METRRPQGLHVGLRCFRNFLRGMETSAARLSRTLPADFRNFLRGMETHDEPDGHRSADHASETSLEGWKLGQVFRFAIAADLLPKLP